MEAIPTAEKFIRSTLKAVPGLAGIPVEPAPIQTADPSVVYQLMTSSDDAKTSDGQVIYSTLVYQVVYTAIAENIGPLVSGQDAIRAGLHFDVDRVRLLPAEILSCQIDRAISFPEQTTRGDIRQNLGFLIRIIVKGPVARALSNPLGLNDTPIGVPIG